MPSVTILAVEDNEPFRRYIRLALALRTEFKVFEVSDGLEAVQSAEQLQPDVILLDVGLPKLNGIEAARRIRSVAPDAKLLFVSQESSPDVVEEAFRVGGQGYVHKLHAQRDLLPAIEAVLRGQQFVSASLTDHDSNATKDEHAAAIGHCHEVEFYADDGSVVDGYARFIESALESGNAVIVVVTEAHRARLVPRLEADGVNVPVAIEQGSYIPLDAADALSRLTVNDTPDPVHCAKVIGDLVTRAAKGVKGEHGRVVVCGEIAPTLLSKGNAEGAIKLEHLWDEITRGYGVHTLCGYLWSTFPDRETSPIFRRICGEHSALHGLRY